MPKNLAEANRLAKQFEEDASRWANYDEDEEEEDDEEDNSIAMFQKSSFSNGRDLSSANLENYPRF